MHTHIAVRNDWFANDDGHAILHLRGLDGPMHAVVEGGLEVVDVDVLMRFALQARERPVEDHRFVLGGEVRHEVAAVIGICRSNKALLVDVVGVGRNWREDIGRDDRRQTY